MGLNTYMSTHLDADADMCSFASMDMCIHHTCTLYLCLYQNLLIYQRGLSCSHSTTVLIHQLRLIYQTGCIGSSSNLEC